MASVLDDRGYNQGFKPSKTLNIRIKRRCDYIVSLMDNEKNNDVLEIGCGLGDLSFHLAQNKNNTVLGTDLCVPFIEKANEKYKLKNLEFLDLDFNDPEKLRNKKFDYIIGNGILHHLYYDIDRALINLKNLLKKGGKIIFLEPNLLNPYCYLIFNTTPFFRNLAKLEPTEKAFTKRFIYNKLRTDGFFNIKVEYKDYLLPVTPGFLIEPVIFFGNIFEKIPIIKLTSQSLFISATKE